MAKAHRAYRHSWWKERYPFAEMSYAEWLEKMNSDLSANKCRYHRSLIRYNGDGTLLQVTFTQQAIPEQNVSQQYRRRLEANRVKRQQEHWGIPGNVEDALSWLNAYLKLADMRNPEKQAPVTKDGKEDYYRDLVIDLYHHSGHGIGESVDIAYSKRGEELIRYLSDDKRHPLNRNRDFEEEVSTAV